MDGGWRMTEPHIDVHTRLKNTDYICGVSACSYTELAMAIPSGIYNE